MFLDLERAFAPRVLRAGLRIGMIAFLTASFASAQADGQSVWDQMKAKAKQAEQQIQQNGQPAKPAPGQAGKPGQPQPASRPGQPSQAVNNTGPFTPPPGTQIVPELMGPFSQGIGYGVSPSGVHVSMTTDSGSRHVVVYDGVTGPKLDQIYTPGNSSGVVFSPDGDHWAYVGILGSEWILYRDGKEYARGAVIADAPGQSLASSGDFHFTSNSQHFYYVDARESGPHTIQYRLVYDGKPGPWGYLSNMTALVSSPDGNHVAYNWDPPNASVPSNQFVIDSQVQPYPANNIRFSADSRRVYGRLAMAASATRPGVAVAIMDGKPVIRADDVNWYIPPTGDMAVAVVHKITGATTFSEALVAGGKLVAGSETTSNGRYQNVVFSPDGKHYASIVQTNQNSAYVFADGQKQQRYTGILGPHNKELTFTADSSTLIYEASNNGPNQFLVINGEESNGVPMLNPAVVGPMGNHSVAWGRTQVLVDGKPLAMPGVDMTISGITFVSLSPDGNHFAFVLQNRNGRSLFVDGAPVPGYSVAYDSGMLVQGAFSYVWSPDSHHVAFVCRSSNPAAGNGISVCVDNKAQDLGMATVYNPIFSSDSKHLFWVLQEPQSTFRAFVDGKPVFDGKSPFPSLNFLPFQSQPDGSLRFVSADQTNNLLRISVTPSPSTNVATLGQ